MDLPGVGATDLPDSFILHQHVEKVDGTAAPRLPCRPAPRASELDIIGTPVEGAGCICVFLGVEGEEALCGNSVTVMSTLADAGRDDLEPFGKMLLTVALGIDEAKTWLGMKGAAL